MPCTKGSNHYKLCDPDYLCHASDTAVWVSGSLYSEDSERFFNSCLTQSKDRKGQISIGQREQKEVLAASAPL